MRRRIATLGLGLVAAGCSLINAYDAVKESPGDDGGVGDDDATGADVTSTSDVTTASESGSSGGGDGSGDVAPADTGAPIDSASETTVTTTPEAAVDAGSPAGAVVIGGHAVNAGVTTNVLSVLEPTTGMEMSRTPMWVLGVAYEGARDLWYIFDTGTAATGPAPSPTIPVVLHVRQLDTRPAGTWAWTELATLTVPQPASGQTIVPLVDRLAYIASVATDSGPASELAVIDTTSLGVPVADASSTPIASAALDFSPVGLVGTPPMTGVGGNLVIVQNTSNAGDAGSFQFMTAAATVNGVTIGSGPYPLGAARNQQQLVGFGASVGSAGYQDLFAAPSVAQDGGFAGTLSEWTTTTTVVEYNNTVTFPATGSRFDPIAFSACSAVAFIAEGLTAPPNQNLVFAVPIAGPSSSIGTFAVSANAVSSVAFEPFTNTVVVASDVASDSFILGLQLGGPGTAPVLSNRTTTWSPPTDLVPTWVATRQPASFTCP